MLSKCLVLSNPDLLLLFVSWMKLANKRSLFVLERISDTLPGLSYNGELFGTRPQQLNLLFLRKIFHSFYAHVRYL